MKKTTIVKIRSIILACAAFVLALCDNEFVLPGFPISIILCALRYSLALLTDAIIEKINDKKDKSTSKKDDDKKK